MRRKCMRCGPGGTESADAPLVVGPLVVDAPLVDDALLAADAPLLADVPPVLDASLVSITTLCNTPVQHRRYHIHIHCISTT